MAKLTKDEKAAKKASKPPKVKDESPSYSDAILKSLLPTSPSGLAPAATGVTSYTPPPVATDYSTYIMYGAIGLGALLLFKMLKGK